MHWAVGGGGGERGALRTVEGTHLHDQPTAPVSTGEGSGGRVLISWGSCLSLLFSTAREF